MANDSFKHHRINPVTGQEDWYFPLEITSPETRETALLDGLEISPARLGFRTFEAVMVPCKNSETVNGRTVYFDTPTEVQHQRYKEFIKDELAEQDRIKQDGRCPIPDGKGGTMRCPCRVSNPAYKPGNGEPKTLPVSCEGCKYEEFKHASTTVPFSSLTMIDSDGEEIPFEPVSSSPVFAADRYVELAGRFERFVEEQDTKLVPLTDKRLLGFNISEAARDLNVSATTLTSRNDKLKVLVEQYLENEVEF